MFETELAGLKSRGINLSALAEDYAILILPENAETAEELFDADDAALLSKLLKESGAKCGNSLDIGIDCPTLERRSHDLWLGLIWILEDGAWQFLISVLANRFTNRGKGVSAETKVHAKFRWEKGGESKKLDWCGDGKELVEALKVIHKPSEEDAT